MAVELDQMGAIKGAPLAGRQSNFVREEARKMRSGDVRDCQTRDSGKFLELGVVRVPVPGEKVGIGLSSFTMNL